MDEQSGSNTDAARLRGMRVRSATQSGSLTTLPGAGARNSRLGAYELREHLAAGSAGVVFDAVRDPDSDNPQIVAIHIPFVRHQQNPAFQDEWLEQTIRLRRMSHPQLVALRDGGLDGVVWRVMARVGGWSLAATQRRARTRQTEIPARSALWLAGLVGEALLSLHASGHWHGRLNSSRVLLLPSGNVKVCGWMSPEQAERADGLTDQPGLLAELAPEQLDGEPGAAPSDVYRLSLLTATMLGGNPFQRTSAAAVREAVLREPVALAAGVPPRIRKVLLEGLARAPQSRPTMRELLGALAQVQDDAGSYDPTEWRTFLGNLFQGISLIGSAGRQAEAAAEADAIRTMIDARDPAPRRAPILTVIAPALQQTPAHAIANPLPAEHGIPLSQLTPSPPTAVLQVPSPTTPPRPASLSARSPFPPPAPVKPAPGQAPMILAALAFLGVGVLVLGWGIGKMQSRNRAVAAVASELEGGSPGGAAAGAETAPAGAAAPAGAETAPAGAAPAGAAPAGAGDPGEMSPEMEGQLRLAEARVREAEARAKEAEARARQAERSGGRVETVYIRTPAPAPATASAATTPAAAPGANPWATPAAPAATAASTAASTAAATPASAPPAAAPPGQLVDLEVSVSGGQVIIRGQQTGGQRAMGFLVEEGNTCEYRVRLKGSTADLGFSRLPISSPLATAVSVSQNAEGTTISVRCTAGMVAPGLSASGSGFTLTLKQK